MMYQWEDSQKLLQFICCPCITLSYAEFQLIFLIYIQPTSPTVVAVFAVIIWLLLLDIFMYLRAIFGIPNMPPTASFHLPTVHLMWKWWFQGQNVTHKRFKLFPPITLQLRKRTSRPAGVASPVQRTAGCVHWETYCGDLSVISQFSRAKLSWQ